MKSVPTLILSILLASVGRSAFAQPQRVLGLDVSYWNRGSSSASANGITQGNWNTAYNTPNANGFTRQFVWIRASRGGTTGLSTGSGTPGNPAAQDTLSLRYDDPEFLRTIHRATTAGLLAGPYHFTRPDNAVNGNTGADEADHFIEFAGAYMRPGYMMPMNDWEADASTVDNSSQFAIDFSNRLYARMQIRPAVYIGGSRSGTIENATQSRQDQLAKPNSVTPSVVGPCYPMLWNPYYANQSNPESIDVQNDNPKAHYSGFYGPWDDYGNSQPWSFWQYASTVSMPGINAVDTGVDGDVSQGDIEYVKNYLVPAIWWNDISGDWSTMTNWNSGQPLSTFNTNDMNNPPAPYSPHWGAGQTTPFTSYTLPVPRLPGTAGSGPAVTSGVHDTVILERPNANITVTLSSGTYNIRKLYMRETLNLVGGSLTVNYDPTYRADNSTVVLHGGPISAQFSGAVTLSNTASFTVHTLQVDTNRIFTLAGGTLTFNKINLMPHASAPARIFMTGDATFNGLANATATIAKGSGSGTSGLLDLNGGSRAFNVGDGTSAVDLSVAVPISNGGLTKTGAGTMQVVSNNTYAGGTTISAGRLLVNNPTGSGTGPGAVTVNGGTLGGTGIISGAVTVSSAGTLAPGNSIGTLTLNSPPVFNGTNFMEIDRNGGSPLADKIVLTSGTLNYGGVLAVTNAGAALVGGEVFTLFSASTYGGGFVSSNLPPLAAGLNWYSGMLKTNGTLKVNRSPVAGPTPQYTNTAPAVVQISFATLVANATDADADTLSLIGISLTSTNGVPLLTNATSVTYSNRASVTDRFHYVLTDNRGGSTTGAVSVVNIGSNPSAQFSSLPVPGGNSVQLHVTAVPGWTYYVERSTNLVNWKTISTNVAPPAGAFDYTDNFSDLGAPANTAFYRLRWVP